mmetsp:Transcript_52922/g.139376  ORF Transcript_52922/g.139376 Transcript_52922/m.139376 type:complete len:1187 (+) Transcript_52922:93-3653(+)
MQNPVPLFIECNVPSFLEKFERRNQADGASDSFVPRFQVEVNKFSSVPRLHQKLSVETFCPTLAPLVRKPMMLFLRVKGVTETISLQFPQRGTGDGLRSLLQTSRQGANIFGGANSWTLSVQGRVLRAEEEVFSNGLVYNGCVLECSPTVLGGMRQAEVIGTMRYEADDDEQVLRALFQSIDLDSDGMISRHELEIALNEYEQRSDTEMIGALKVLLRNMQLLPPPENGVEVNESELCNASMEASISFEAFKDCLSRIPRMRSERVLWAKALNIELALASLLPVGDVFDGLGGLKRDLDLCATDAAIVDYAATLSLRLCETLNLPLMKALRKLKDGALTKLTSSIAQQHVNSKFVMDGAFVGKFATLDEFYRGPEQLIGIPNPNVLEGAEREHTQRGNAAKKFVTTNYNICTWPALEWEFVVSPKEGCNYPHYPSDRSLWKQGNDWKGECGRTIQTIKSLMQHTQVKRAALQIAEVISMRLYTGPMFVLYNAVLRGFPAREVECLCDEAGNVNKYETTIFCITSGITKLAKISDVPQNRKLYRGLGGMVLPDQFWKSFVECQIVFKFKASKTIDVKEAVEALKKFCVTQKAQVMNSDHELETTRLLLVGKDIEEPPKSALKSPGLVAVIEEVHAFRLVISLPLSKFDLTKEDETWLEKSCGRACKGMRANIVSISNKPSDFKGGVEFGLLSTTTDMNTALEYSGAKKNRGIVFEIEASRIDVGASMQFLSQYPGEAEFLMPPLTCLEVVGEPILERRGQLEVLLIPIRVNVNLKAVTVEDLMQRRKYLHLGMVKNLREELVNDIRKMLDSGRAMKAVEDFKTANPGLDVDTSSTSEFEDIAQIHEQKNSQEFNNDGDYKTFVSEMLDAKVCLVRKQKLIFEAVQACAPAELIQRLLEIPYTECQGASVQDETGLSLEAILKGGVRNKQAIPLKSSSAEISVLWHAVLSQEKVSHVVIGEIPLDKKKVSNVLRLRRRNIHHQKYRNPVLGLLLSSAPLTLLDLRGAEFRIEESELSRVILSEPLGSSLEAFNGLSVRGNVIQRDHDGSDGPFRCLHPRTDLDLLELSLSEAYFCLNKATNRRPWLLEHLKGQQDTADGFGQHVRTVMPALARILRHHVCALDFRYNEIGDGGTKVLAATLAKAGLSSLQALDLRNNEIGDEGAKSLAAALPGAGLVSLKILDLQCVE